MLPLDFHCTCRLVGEGGARGQCKKANTQQGMLQGKWLGVKVVGLWLCEPVTHLGPECVCVCVCDIWRVLKVQGALCGPGILQEDQILGAAGAIISITASAMTLSAAQFHFPNGSVFPGN